MAKGSTFPATDVPPRRGLILDVLARHDPVPVPTTTLYLSVEDKRALADEFARLAATGEIEPCHVAPGEPVFAEVLRLTGLGPAAGVAPVAAYRLTEVGRSARR